MPDLSALTRLEILYLHDNALTDLPRLPESVTYLNVSENPLRELPAWRLEALIELRALDLGLTALPAFELPALRELHLRRNALAAVPEVVRSLRELRLLDLRANRLKSVPGLDRRAAPAGEARPALERGLRSPVRPDRARLRGAHRIGWPAWLNGSTSSTPRARTSPRR